MKIGFLIILLIITSNVDAIVYNPLDRINTKNVDKGIQYDNAFVDNEVYLSRIDKNRLIINKDGIDYKYLIGNNISKEIMIDYSTSITIRNKSLFYIGISYFTNVSMPQYHLNIFQVNDKISIVAEYNSENRIQLQSISIINNELVYIIKSTDPFNLDKFSTIILFNNYNISIPGYIITRVVKDEFRSNSGYKMNYILLGVNSIDRINNYIDRKFALFRMIDRQIIKLFEDSSEFIPEYLVIKNNILSIIGSNLENIIVLNYEITTLYLLYQNQNIISIPGNQSIIQVIPLKYYSKPRAGIPVIISARNIDFSNDQLDQKSIIVFPFLAEIDLFIDNYSNASIIWIREDTRSIPGDYLFIANRNTDEILVLDQYQQIDYDKGTGLFIKYDLIEYKFNTKFSNDNDLLLQIWNFNNALLLIIIITVIIPLIKYISNKTHIK